MSMHMRELSMEEIDAVTGGPIWVWVAGAVAAAAISTAVDPFIDGFSDGVTGRENANDANDAATE